MSVIDQLVDLVEQLYEESAGYIDNPADAQIWYNRGYANGVAAFLCGRGQEAKLKKINLDDLNIYKNEQIMIWHKAYHHGYEMGERESAEVFPSASS